MRSALALPLFAAALLPGHAQLQAQAGPPHAQQPNNQLPPPCQAVDLSTSVVTVFNPAEPQGLQLMMLQLYNSGPTCSISGLPTIEFSATATRDYTNKLIPLALDDEQMGLAPNAIPGTVVLQHGELAQMRLTWSTDDHINGHKLSCRALDALLITLPNDAPLTEIVALHTHVCGALHLSHFVWGWVKQSNVLRASWAPDAGPTDEVPYTPATGSVFGDHFNGIAMSLKATTSARTFPLGADIQLESHVKNIDSPREPVIGEHPYRWLSMRESNGHTVLYSLGTAPPNEAGEGTPVPRGQGIRLPNLNLRDMGMLPQTIGKVTYALTAEFWPASTNANGSIDSNATAYAPTAVVSYRLTLNFTAGN